MTILDVFNTDAFSALSMTQAVERVPFQPSMLGDMGLFAPKPIRTTDFAIEGREGVLTLIKTDERGAPPRQRVSELRNVRRFSTQRIAQADTLFAHELQNIRAFGSETEPMAVQAEVARRMSGPTGLVANIGYTHENMRLGAIQGKVVDADGSLIYDWFAEFGVDVPAEVGFDLANATPASGVIRKRCTAIKRAMRRAAKGAWLPSTSVHALCGDAYWDDLIASKEVRETYLNHQAAADLRGDASGGESFSYGGITFHNYVGSDDNSEVAVPVDKAKFFPVGAPGVFEVAFAPAETFDFVNTMGRPVYSWNVVDKDRNAWVAIEAYSYPAFYCTRPGMLQTGRRGA